MNIRLKSLFSVGLLSLLCLMLPKAARADDFTFSFTGPLGTVTGEIFGLTPNTTSAATDVTITSFPAAFASDPDLSTPVTDIFAAPWDVVTNEFTESSGAITVALFIDQYTAGDVTSLELSSPSFASFLHDPIMGKIDEAAPLIFTPVAAPEPSSFDLMLIGLMALGTLVAVSTQKKGQALES